MFEKIKTKIKIKKEKRGEMTSATVVGIIILIIGFAILLYFYFSVWGNDRADKETCHQSVLIRATGGSLNYAGDFPLKCKTAKLCVTNNLVGKGNCKEYENENGITKAKVSKTQDIEKLISQEIVDCWNMMGQGRLSLYSNSLATQFGVGDVYSTCIICSRIAFDDASLVNAGIDKNNVNIVNYMMTHKIPNGNETYWKYLVGDSPAQVSTDIFQTKSIQLIDPETTQIVTINLEENKNIEDSKKSELAVLFMQISAPTKKEVLKNSLMGFFGVGAAGMVTSPGLTIKVASKVGGFCVSGPIQAIFCGAVLIGAGGLQMYSANDNMNLATRYCGDVSSNAAPEEGRVGCSVVRATSYDYEGIRQYCNVIESMA